MVSPERLLRLEAEVRRALAGQPAELEVLGRGEVSLVLAIEEGGRRWACKRLPRFKDLDQFRRYQAVYDAYVAGLAERQISPLENRLIPLEVGGSPMAYCVQPALGSSDLAVRRLATANEAERREILGAIFAAISRAAGPTFGLDGQLSNWAFADGRLVYLDLTTPLLRDDQGCERLDGELFLASIPWALRGLVRRFFVKDILDPYYSPRTVARDLLGNLIKEGLEHCLPLALECAGQTIPPAWSESEILVQSGCADLGGASSLSAPRPRLEAPAWSATRDTPAGEDRAQGLALRSMPSSL